jgi:hypothetical protein
MWKHPVPWHLCPWSKDAALIIVPNFQWKGYFMRRVRFHITRTHRHKPPGWEKENNGNSNPNPSILSALWQLYTGKIISVCVEFVCGKTGLVMSSFVHVVTSYWICPISILLGIGYPRVVIQCVRCRSSKWSYSGSAAGNPLQRF